MFKQFIPLTLFLVISSFIAPESNLEARESDWTQLAARCHEICQGPQGGIGPEGFPGVMGSTGPQGAQGEVGAQGQVGARGATGPTGGQGIVGAQGPAGPNGPQGATGFTGPAGTTGATGPAGARGTTGIPGPDGLLQGFGWAINPVVQADIAPDEIVALIGFISQSGGYSLSPDGGVIVPESGDYQIYFAIVPDTADSNVRLEVNGSYAYPSAFSVINSGSLFGNVILTLAKGDVVTIVNNNLTGSFGTAQGEFDLNTTTPASMTILQLTSTETTAASQACCDLLFGTTTP